MSNSTRFDEWQITILNNKLWILFSNKILVRSRAAKVGVVHPFSNNRKFSVFRSNKSWFCLHSTLFLRDFLANTSLYPQSWIFRAATGPNIRIKLNEKLLSLLTYHYSWDRCCDISDKIFTIIFFIACQRPL